MRTPNTVPSLPRKLALVAALALFSSALTACGLFAAKPKTTATSGGIASVLHLDPFVVNLADPDGKSFLRTSIDLGLGSPAASDKQVDPVPLVRDTILSVLADSKSDTLLTTDGKTKLRADIQQALNTRMPALQVHEVYLTEFLVQR